ncbi:hypothetical protein EX895_000280 [Sporisorium graminicola]|uniref:WD repeat-containing protein 44 n=1 Tax=Sporisorium graminicola TaxID=280036 RepID=A0A4U7L4C2_9BASI|nr:hypothetical protein EX895_000280 [Sporisorium graminicola]TKY90282.1 hypothetical protein EX895_000280 [Sporisorium graminicola]
MPMLIFNEPEFGPIWPRRSGRFAASHIPVFKPEARRDRRAIADATLPRDPHSSASESAAWFEHMYGSAPTNRSTTFSSISSASCSSSSSPSMDKVCSHDRIRSSETARPTDAESPNLCNHSTIPHPKVIKIKPPFKSKPGEDVDFDNVFLAQELHASLSSSGRNATMGNLSSRVQQDLSTTLSAEKRPKRSSWAAGRSPSSRAIKNTAQVSAVTNSNPDHDTEWHARRSRIDGRFSFGRNSTTALSATSRSSDVGDTFRSRSRRFNGGLEPHGDTKSKSIKSTTSKPQTYALQFSLDGRYLAAAGSDHLIRLYKVISSPEDRADEIDLARMPHEKECCHRKISPAYSQRPCAWGRNSTKSDVRGVAPELAPIFKSNPVHVFAGHTGDVQDLSWSKNNFLLSCSSDKTARLWHPDRSDSLCTFTTSAVVSSVDFHPADDRYFVTGGLDGKLRLWNITARRVHSTHDVHGFITAVAFSSSGAAVFVGTRSGSLLAFECTDTLQYVRAVTVKSANKGSQVSKITSIQPIKLDATESTTDLSAKSRAEYITITSNDSRVRIYSINSQRLVSHFKATRYINRTSQIRATSSSDFQYIVSGSEDASIHIWSVKSNAPLSANMSAGVKRNKSFLRTQRVKEDNINWRCWEAGSGSVRCAVFAPAATEKLLALAHDPILKDGGKARIVVSSDDSNSIRVWRSDPFGRFF